jgi:outer membrane protein OmpA-like peptidoglycan-associated protein
VQPGGSSTITSVASSPDNRRLTYNYSATAGSISGNDSTTTLNAGNSPGSITVTCNVADDRNPALTASATTAVNVVAPPPQAPPTPAAPEASKLNQIDFKKNSPRVDNAAKAILDEVALRLQRDSDAKVVLVGEADPSEKNAAQLASQRAFNAKTYLVTEKGIDASRIETRTGSEGTQQTQIWLVPAGATFNAQGTQVAEPTAPKARRRK